MSTSWRDLENVILRIPDVQGAQVLTDDEENPKIHVLANSERAPRHIVREITALVRSFGWANADPDWVTVVQVHEDDDSSFSATRLTIAGFSVGHVAEGISATCRLRRSDLVYQGTALGPTIPAAMSMATIGSVNQALADLGQLRFNGVNMILSGGTEVFLVTVAEAGEEILSGSAVVRDTLEDSVIRATLDAVNRRFLVYTGRKL